MGLIFVIPRLYRNPLTKEIGIYSQPGGGFETFLEILGMEWNEHIETHIGVVLVKDEVIVPTYISGAEKTDIISSSMAKRLLELMEKQYEEHFEKGLKEIRWDTGRWDSVIDKPGREQWQQCYDEFTRLLKLSVEHNEAIFVS